MGIDAGILETVSLVTSIAGAGIGALGSIASANAQANAANYQAQVARNNSILAEQQAQRTMAAGEQAAMQKGLQTRAKVGAIRAAQAASNVDVNSGSALDVQSSAAELGQLDTERETSRAALQAYGYRTQSSNFQAEAGLDEAKASSARIGGAFGAVGSLLSGAGNAAGKYAQWQGLTGSGYNYSGPGPSSGGVFS